MQHLLLDIVKKLVDKPLEASIEIVDSPTIIVLQICVDKSDIGKVVGKNGKMIHSIREIFTSIASRKKQRIYLEIIE